MSKQTKNTVEALLVPSPMFGAKAAELVLRQCLDVVRHSVDLLIVQYEENDDRGSTPEEETADVNAYNALRMVRDEIKRLAAPDTIKNDIEEGWWCISGVVGMIAVTCPKTGTIAGNMTKALMDDLGRYPGLWMHIEERPRYVTQAPGQHAANGGRVKQ